MIQLIALSVFLNFSFVEDPGLWGIPITPELLEEQGKLDVAYPSEKYSAAKDWEQTWRIWLPGRAKPNSKSGYLKIARHSVPDQAELNYQIHQVISEDNSWLHSTRAEITAGKNISAIPVRWTKTTQFYHSAGIGVENEKDISSWSEVSLDGMPEGSTGNYVPSFTLIDVIQRMNACHLEQLDFTLLDELDKVKENHRIRFTEETFIQFAGESRKVRCYEECGEGLLPWNYYVGEEGWLLLAISGMRTYVLDPGFENEYPGTYEAQKETGEEISPGNGSQPNILFITTDQQAWNTISANGCKYVNTPNLDQLARTGVSFKKSYTPNPVCSPARACWLTGLTSSENGVINNGMSIIENIETVGDVLTEKGYETVFAGKLHVGIPDSYQQEIAGFSKVLCEGIGGKGTLGDQVVSSVCEGYLQNRDKSKPFFLAVHFLQPHDICNWITRNNENKQRIPYLDMIEKDLPSVPDNLNSRNDEPKDMKVARNEKWDEQNWRYYLWSYYRMVEEADAEIGRVLRALEASGEMDHTVIIFNSDHGEGMGHHQSVTKNFLYDEACNVPFIISYPRELQQGVLDEHHLVSGLDVVPTICDFAGGEPPLNYRGMSLRELASGKNPEWRDFVVTEVSNDKGRMIRTSDYKLIAFRNDPKILFFDMKNDPGETTNLANNPEYRDQVKNHIEMLEGWESKLNLAPNALEAFKVTL